MGTCFCSSVSSCFLVPSRTAPPRFICNRHNPNQHHQKNTHAACMLEWWEVVEWFPFQPVEAWLPLAIAVGTYTVFGCLLLILDYTRFPAFLVRDESSLMTGVFARLICRVNHPSFCVPS
jgi:hypothetical protein